MSADGFVMDLDLNDYDPEKAEGGYEPVKPGRAHVLIAEFEPHVGKNGSHKFVFEVLAHEADAKLPDQEKTEVAKTHHEYIPNQSNCMYRMRELAIGAGLITRQDANDAKAEGRPLRIDWGSVKGRQMFVKFASDTYNGEPKATVGDKGAGFYSLDNPKAKDWPRNAALYEKGLALLKSGQQPVAAVAGSASQPADDDF